MNQRWRISAVLANDIKFLEFSKFLEVTLNTWNFGNSWKWRQILRRHLYFWSPVSKIFLCLQTKVSLFTFSMFIYIFCRLFWENFWKWLQLSRRYLYFWSPVSKFLFVCKQDLFIYIFCRLFWKNSWKWRKILGIFRKIRIFMKFYVLTCEYLSFPYLTVVTAFFFLKLCTVFNSFFHSRLSYIYLLRLLTSYLLMTNTIFYQ